MKLNKLNYNYYSRSRNDSTQEWNTFLNSEGKTNLYQVYAQSKYKLRYKFSGNVDLAYSYQEYGEPELENHTKSNEYRIRWTHTQDAKARPNSNFSANVNFTSRNENKYNAVSSEEYLSNTTSSSISCCSLYGK